MNQAVIPAIIRGEIITSDLVEFGGRDGEASFLAPDPKQIIGKLPLRDPGKLRDLYDIPFSEVIDYLDELSKRLHVSNNRHMQEAIACVTPMSDMTPPVLAWSYEQIAGCFEKCNVTQIADRTIGIQQLDGWGEMQMINGGTAAVRAFGARCMHIIAGNSPLVASQTIVSNAITRGDAIIKLPSNDPLTVIAIAKTMIEMAPDHPLTRHLSCAYWKGGSIDLEEQLYQPRNIEKIIAWGGFNSVKHVTRYIQPGLELISLDPKRSATVIGPEAFSDDETLNEVAIRTATDIGALNQLACVNARVIYVMCGSDDAGLARAKKLGRMIYQELAGLPENISTKSKRFSPDLREALTGLRGNPDFYTVIGGQEDEGAVIVSHTSEPVDFYTSLNCRIANIIPVDEIREVVEGMTSYSQTIGVYPESLKKVLRDILPLYGAQRLVSLGYAIGGSIPAVPQDSIELLRRMVKWILEETSHPDRVEPVWVQRDSTCAESRQRMSAP